MINKKYYLSKSYPNLNAKSSKAKSDIEAFMDQTGIRNIGLPQAYQ